MGSTRSRLWLFHGSNSIYFRMAATLITMSHGPNSFKVSIQVLSLVRTTGPVVSYFFSGELLSIFAVSPKTWILYGCFGNLGVLSVGLLVIRALLF